MSFESPRNQPLPVVAGRGSTGAEARRWTCLLPEPIEAQFGSARSGRTGRGSIRPEAELHPLHDEAPVVHALLGGRPPFRLEVKVLVPVSGTGIGRDLETVEDIQDFFDNADLVFSSLPFDDPLESGASLCTAFDELLDFCAGFGKPFCRRGLCHDESGVLSFERRGSVRGECRPCDPLFPPGAPGVGSGDRRGDGCSFVCSDGGESGED